MNQLPILHHFKLCLLGRTGQSIRFRYSPDPGTLEQRLFRAVTKPVIPPININPNERRLRKMEEDRLRKENNPYRKFLIEKAKEEFLKPMENNMVLVFQQLYHKAREIVPVQNKLFLKDMHFKGFPLSILREAAQGTRYEMFTRYFLHSKCGIVDYRIMTVQQLNDFASLSSQGLDGVRSHLVMLLEQTRGGQIVQDLNYHQSFIVGGLKDLSNEMKNSDVSSVSSDS
ncbi:39S ribosomal mitochondrial protein [Schistosoma japonicum]|uniref:Large ribosomal subunit protein uL10m n=1 Tax=Schistosoma japonicum TaxID=6182 RepID=A0A4Z2DXG3_SCHJA|nr:39S ribosomal mitochondrial protein [Schistosoma japonicum]